MSHADDTESIMEDDDGAAAAVDDVPESGPRPSARGPYDEAPPLRAVAAAPRTKQQDAWFSRIHKETKAFVSRMLEKRRDVLPESKRDAQQSIYFTVDQEIRENGPPENAYAMLVRITGNVLANHGRVARRRPHASGVSPEDLSAPEPRADTLLEEKERRAWLHTVLEQMKPEDAAVIALVDLAELPHDEAAEAVGISRDALTKRHARARRRFADLVKALQEKRDLGGGK